MLYDSQDGIMGPVTRQKSQFEMFRPAIPNENQRACRRGFSRHLDLFVRIVAGRQDDGLGRIGRGLEGLVLRP